MSFLTWLRNQNRCASVERRRLHGPAHKSAVFRPRLEALEDRYLPSFGNPITTAVYHPVALVAADLNGDGKPDLVVGDGSGSVSVLLAKGNGVHFANPVYYQHGGYGTIAVAVGDINGDGKLDIVTENDPGDGGFFGEPDSISVLLGNGNGTFAPAQTFWLPQQSGGSGLAVGDFNGDGKLDVVTADGGHDSVTVLLNEGSPSFFVASHAQIYTIPAAGRVTSVAVGDLNGDGKPDIVATAYLAGTANVLLNKADGTGTFGAAQSYSAGGLATAVAVGDFNGDGKLDLAVTNGSNNTTSVLQNNGDGTFAAAHSNAVGGAANSVAVADFNGDGKLDIVTAGAEMDLLLGNGDGTFATAQKVGPAGSSVVVADFNGDRWLDLAQINASGASIDVLLNQADWNKRK